MKKWFVIAVVLCASVMNAEAGQVNEQEARQKAMSFMSQRSMTRSMTNLSRVSVNICRALVFVNVLVCRQRL